MKASRRGFFQGVAGVLAGGTALAASNPDVVAQSAPRLSDEDVKRVADAVAAAIHPPKQNAVLPPAPEQVRMPPQPYGLGRCYGQGY